MHCELLPVDLDDFTPGALITAPDDRNLIVLPDGGGSDAILLSKVLGQRGRHDTVSKVGWCSKVSSSGLSSGAGDFGVGLHGYKNVEYNGGYSGISNYAFERDRGWMNLRDVN